LKKRAERFGVAQNPTEDKLAKRRERFGVVEDKSNASARERRLGLPLGTQKRPREPNTLGNSMGRKNNTTTTNNRPVSISAEDEAKKKQRLERFSTKSSTS